MSGAHQCLVEKTITASMQDQAQEEGRTTTVHSLQSSGYQIAEFALVGSLSRGNATC